LLLRRLLRRNKRFGPGLTVRLSCRLRLRLRLGLRLGMSVDRRTKAVCGCSPSESTPFFADGGIMNLDLNRFVPA
jgi:hypothetical protein